MIKLTFFRQKNSLKSSRCDSEYGLPLEDLAKNGRLDFLKCFFTNNYFSRSGYNEIYSIAAPEVKEFMEKWSEIHESLLGKCAVSLDRD